jgi:hypothetical protein
VATLTLEDRSKTSTTDALTPDDVLILAVSRCVVAVVVVDTVAGLVLTGTTSKSIVVITRALAYYVTAQRILRSQENTPGS